MFEIKFIYYLKFELMDKRPNISTFSKKIYRIFSMVYISYFFR